MTVRWKPLMILSGLFVVVALVGVVAITVAMMPRSAQGILKLAHSAREAGRYKDAVIYYKQALQADPRNASIHEDFAGLYRDWGRQAPEDQRAELRTGWLEQTSKAIEIDKSARAPRRERLRDAMDLELTLDAIYWSKDLLSIAADDLDAHYVLAAEGLEERTPNIPEIKRHVEALEKSNAPLIRRLWLRARLAERTGDEKALAAALDQARKSSPPASGEPDVVDRFARLRLAAVDVQKAADWQPLANRVNRLREQVKALGKPEELPPGRIARLRAILEFTQRSLADRSPKLPPDGRKSVAALADAIEVDIEAMFRQALADGRQPDLQTYLAYADHLRLRRQPERSLEVVTRALQTPQASQRGAMPNVLGLHLVAVDVILARADDAGRFDKAAPHVKALVESSEPRYQALGHLLAGSIDLDRSGVARELTAADQASSAKVGTATDSVKTTDAAAVRAGHSKLLTSALNHLKLAAAGLPDVAEAQAKYGVALVLTQEQDLGRQYLQKALRLQGSQPQGVLDTQYQLWAAWTILQAGYPEEAEPIVQAMLRQVEQGTLPRDMEGSLHLLQGELYQARRGPEDLKRAAVEFDRARAAGQAVTPTVAIRLAQIDVQLGRYDSALARLEALRAQGKGGATAEHLAVLTLEQMGRKPDARALLKQGRDRYPKSGELAGLEAALLVKDRKPAEADAVLERFLREQPEDSGVAMMRAQILADELKAPDRAREVLEAVAGRTDSSAPLIQLAALELNAGRIEAASAVVAKIRARWKDSASVDVLEGQIALRRGKTAEAVAHFNAALKKDPNNKIVQYWKARIDSRNGSEGEAARALEEIVRDRPVKEVDDGTTLLSAAQSALAGLSLQSRDFDEAIRRFEELKRSSRTGTLSREDRWKLITAYVNKDQWSTAKREIAAILNNAKEPPSNEERVRGASLYRQQGESAAAMAQLDYVLKVDPTNPSAVVTRAYILLQDKQPDQSAAVLRSAIERASGDAKKPAPAVFYLMLAAVENERPPLDDALSRAIKVLEEGLAAHPREAELVKARSLALTAAGRGPDAIAFLESKAKEDPKGPFRRMLVEKLRDAKQYERAESLLSALHQEFPDESNLAAALVQVVSLEAAEAAARGQDDRRRQLEDRAAGMIRKYRTEYPSEVSFLQAECDMAARRGDFTGALSATREIDKVAPSSTLGPLLRVRLYGLLDRPEEVAKAYGEAIDRERGARQADYRLLLGQLRLRMGDADEAIRQTGLVLAADKRRIDAALLQSRALAESGATPSERELRRRDAVARLRAMIHDNPRYGDAYRGLADILLKAGDRAAALTALQDDLKANPQDAAAAGLLVEWLANGSGKNAQTAEADLTRARRVAREIADRDTKGAMILAVAGGFQRAQQFDEALPLARQAVAKLDSPAAHLALGDLLLSIAEKHADGASARTTFTEAVAEYDRVLAAVPDSIEAVNNKAWILHTYLGKSREALDLVLALRDRAIPVTLPCEFFDTMGAIQESVGKAAEAESSYTDGLKKDDRNAVLNFHFGRLLAADRSRATKARMHLGKALAARDRLTPAMAEEADSLIRKLGGSIKAN
ncbi:MAG: tetratricopeptide repeat protein [Isosphaeraceae bacterium]